MLNFSMIDLDRGSYNIIRNIIISPFWTLEVPGSVLRLARYVSITIISI